MPRFDRLPLHVTPQAVFFLEAQSCSMVPPWSRPWKTAG